MAKRRRAPSATQFESSISDITSGLDQTVKDLNKAADALRTQIGKDMFDTSEAEAYLDALKDIDKELRSFIDDKKLQGFALDFAENISKSIGNQILEGIEDLNYQKAADNISKAFKTPLEELFDNFSDYVKKIPFVGDTIYNSLGIDAIKEQLTENLRDAFSEAAVDGKVSMESLSMALSSTFGAMAKVVTGVLKTVFLNPWLLALAAVVAIGMKFSDLQGQAESFRETTGLTLGQSRELTNEIQKSAMGVRLYGVELEDVYNTAGALLEKFGNVNLVSAELSTDLAKMSKLTGATTENLVGAYGVFRGMEGATDASAVHMLDALSSAAHLAGIPINSVMEDVATNAGFVAEYMGQSADQLYKTAIQAKLLGLGLDNVGKIMDSIMDFEDSIEKELQASILIGKQLDFNRARYLAFNGDIESATKNIMNQVGGMEAFNKMNVIQKKALAEAIGLSVEELKTSLEIQDRLSKMTMKEIEDEKMIAGELTQIKDLFGQIGASLTTVILPVITGIAWVLGGIADGLRGVFGIFDGLPEWFSGFLKVATVLALILVSLLAIKAVMFGMGKLSSMLPGFLGGKGGGKQMEMFGKGGGGFLSKIGDSMRGFMESMGKINPATMIKGALALIIMAGSLYVLALALKQFAGIDWATIAMAGVALLGLLGIGLIAAAFGSALVIGAVGILIMAAALYVLALALQQFVPVFSGFADGINRLKDVSFAQLAGIAGGIALIGLALAAFGMTGLFGMFGLLTLLATTAALASLAGLGPGLAQVASSLQSIKTSMEGGFNLEGLTDVPEEINIPTIVSAQIADAIITSNSMLGEKLDAVRAAIENQDNNTYLDGAKLNKGMGKTITPPKTG